MEIVKKEAPTIISSAEQAIALYTLTPATISAQLKKYDDLKVIEGNTKSYKAVRAAHTALVTTRTTGDKRRKKLGEDARKQVSFINKAWAMLLSPMTPYEDRFKAELKAEDDRKQAIKDEKDRIEQERIDVIDKKIQAFDHAVGTTIGMSSEQVATLCDEIVAIQITEEVYQEFTAKAKEVKLATLSALDDIYNEKVQTEKEDAARKAEIEKIEKLRAEQEEGEAKRHEELRQIEAEKQAAQKIIDDERAKLEKEKQAEQEKQDRAEFERKAQLEANAKAAREAEEKILQQEKKSIAAQIEAKRKAELRPDKEKLIAFAYTLTHIELPDVRSDEAKKIKREASVSLDELTFDIREKTVVL